MSKRQLRFPAAVVLLLISIGCMQAMSSPREVQLVRPLSEIPLCLGIWSGSSITFDEKTLDNAGVDHYIMRTYYAPDHAPVSVYVGFYSHQRVGHTIHSPRRCYPGSGWEVVSTGKAETPAPGSDGKHLLVNRMLIRRENSLQVVYYWFQSRGRIVAGEYREKIYLILDTIFTGRNDGTLVRVSTDAGTAPRDADEVLQAFIGEFHPQLEQCLP